jgi:hypothetical protein
MKVESIHLDHFDAEAERKRKSHQNEKKENN